MRSTTPRVTQPVRVTTPPPPKPCHSSTQTCQPRTNTSRYTPRVFSQIPHLCIGEVCVRKREECIYTLSQTPPIHSLQPVTSVFIKNLLSLITIPHNKHLPYTPCTVTNTLKTLLKICRKLASPPSPQIHS